MKKSGHNLFLIFFLFFTIQVKGQVTFNFSQPDLFLFKTSHLDNISILNSGSIYNKVTIVYSVIDLNKDEIVSVSFPNVSLPKGTSKFYQREGKLEWGRSPLAVKLRGGGLNKEGISLSVKIYDENESRDILEQYQDLMFIPPTPLELEYPENKSTIDNLRPNFEWIPSTPLISEITYNLILVEKREKQTCTEALEQNQFLIRKNSIITNRINYPIENTMLDFGKSYCWRVASVLENIESSFSEIWEFKVKKDSQSMEIFIPFLNEIQSPTVYKVYNNEFRFALENKRIEKELNWTIEDGQSKKILLSTENQKILLNRGIHQYSIDCTSLPSGKIYILNVYEVNDKKYSVTFSK
jgi:hypothetical protein